MFAFIDSCGQAVLGPVVIVVFVGAGVHYGAAAERFKLKVCFIEISSGVVFKLNTIWPTKFTTHRMRYHFYELTV